jgi:hypothetical protein
LPQTGQRPVSPRPMAVNNDGTGHGGSRGVRSGCQWIGAMGLVLG